jgi:hypothetical protein
MKRNLAVSIFAIFLAAACPVLTFAQGNQTTQQAVAALPVSAEWLYGEINSVDISGKSLTLTYLDYDTDIEKQATVLVDDKTIFENVKSLEEIKPQDMVSIDYIVGADSKNLASSISVEKLESAEDFNMEGAVPAEPKQQMKPAVEDIAVPEAADLSPEPEKGQ